MLRGILIKTRITKLPYIIVGTNRKAKKYIWDGEPISRPTRASNRDMPEAY